MAVRRSSTKAYREKVLPNLTSKQSKVLRAVYKWDPDDFTNAELAEKMGFMVNRVTPRTGELREKGLLEETDKRECKRTGSTGVQAMQLSDDARRVLDKNSAEVANQKLL